MLKIFEKTSCQYFVLCWSSKLAQAKITQNVIYNGKKARFLKDWFWNFSLLGASQHCCYDIRGNLMHVFDSRYGSTPDRSHPWGIYPHLYPPRIPDWCHYQYDLMPYFYCCEWSEFCDPYYWRRPSDDCQTYVPPKSGITECSKNHIDMVDLGWLTLHDELPSLR